MDAPPQNISLTFYPHELKEWAQKNLVVIMDHQKIHEQLRAIHELYSSYGGQSCIYIFSATGGFYFYFSSYGGPDIAISISIFSATGGLAVKWFPTSGGWIGTHISPPGKSKSHFLI